MQLKHKLLTALLILIFVASAGVVVAQDSADADELEIADADESIALSEETDEPLAAEQDAEVLAASEQDSSSEDSKDSTSLDIKVEVLDKNPKVGDEIRVKITVKNTGKNPANDVLAGFSFTDLYENPDFSFKLVDDGGYDVSSAEGGYEVNFGFLDAGDTKEVIFTFLATEAGTKKIFSNVVSDNSELEPESEDSVTFTVSEKSSESTKAKASTSKTLHATGNPLALLALALFCLVPYYRRK